MGRLGETLDVLTDQDIQDLADDLLQRADARPDDDTRSFMEILLLKQHLREVSQWIAENGEGYGTNID